LAEELNFTRAADKLHISQPALSGTITDLEEQHRFHLFSRDKRLGLELTDAGRIFLEEARFALLHGERAVHLARAAHEGSDTVLTIGHSPYTDHHWISATLAIRLPLYPRLRIQLMTQFAMESIRSVLEGEVNLALVMAPPQDAQITAVPFAPTPLYAAVPENHPAAPNERLVLQDLAKDEWILFANGFIHLCMRQSWMSHDLVISVRQRLVAGRSLTLSGYELSPAWISLRLMVSAERANPART
jgi:DNA-binding transcriptional LysR family regulator